MSRRGASGRPDKHRAISIGTVLGILLSLTVLFGMLSVIRMLSGDAVLEGTNLAGGAQTLLEGLTPKREIGEIPIVQETEVPLLVMQPTSTQAPREGTARVTFTGTMALETEIRQSGYSKTSKTYDFSDILMPAAASLRSDLCVAALENLVSPSDTVSDLIAPDEVMGMLVSGNVDQVALGFGRSFDRGYEGLSATVLSAQSHGLEAVGAYRNEGEAALSEQIHSIDGIRLAVLHYTEALTNAGRKALTKDGRIYAVPLLEQAVQDIPLVRSLGADFVIVSVHWGTEGKSEVTKAQRTAAEMLCRAGADVIVGNGPRRLQSVERMNVTDEAGQVHEALCAFSLGCTLSSSTKTAAMQSFLLHLTITKSAEGEVSYVPTYTPLYVWRYRESGSMRYRVVIADGDAPDGMSADQQKKRTSAASAIEKMLGGGLSREEK